MTAFVSIVKRLVLTAQNLTLLQDFITAPSAVKSALTAGVTVSAAFAVLYVYTIGNILTVRQPALYVKRLAPNTVSLVLTLSVQSVDATLEL